MLQLVRSDVMMLLLLQIALQHTAAHLTCLDLLECNYNHVTVTSEWQTSGMLLPPLRRQSQTTVHTEARQTTKVDAPPLAHVPWCHNVLH